MANERAPQQALFGAGCFWGVETAFTETPGVTATQVGYCGGNLDRPTYDDVCSGTSGHTEVVLVQFDPAKISYQALLERFFAIHDPTQLNRQGPDVGDQYRSGIWTVDEGQKKVAEEVLGELKTRKDFGEKPIVTIVESAKTFWPAEEYHQEYLAKNGAACHVKNPW